MTAPRRKLIPAREYLRVSLDTSGRERSNTEQHDDNVVAAKEHGWRLGEPYSDVGSASRHARKRRDGFDVLIADLEADPFGAELLVLWESSRGSRKVGEWVQLVDLCEKRGVKIAVTSHGGRVYDPTIPRDRRSLLEDAVDSEYESSKLSLRIKRATRANAAAGRPHGRVPYGYKRTFDPTTGKLDRQVLDPVEAPVVLELFERMAAGHSLRSIERDFDARGIRTRNGVKFVSQIMRPMLEAPVYNGKRSHVPGTVHISRQERRQRETLIDAQWDAIVPDALYLAVQHRLRGQTSSGPRPGKPVHLLSMIARCDVCDSVLVATYRDTGVRRYQCRDACHVFIPADDLDAYVEAQMLTFLTRRENVGKVLAGDDDDRALVDARDAQARVRRELDDLIDQVGRGKLSATLAAGAEPAIQARLAEATRLVDELSTPPLLRGLIDPAGDVRAQWKAAPLTVRREIARIVLAPGMRGELRVKRSPVRGHAAPVEQRIDFRDAAVRP
jgi:DNA invertase Pin-like site-specific DNA recombinase